MATNYTEIINQLPRHIQQKLTMDSREKEVKARNLLEYYELKADFKDRDSIRNYWCNQISALAGACHVNNFGLAA